MTEILELLGTFTAVQRRMILHDSLASREAGKIFSLQRLSREVVQLSLLTNNTQERLAGPLVDRLRDDLGWNGRKGRRCCVPWLPTQDLDLVSHIYCFD